MLAPQRRGDPSTKMFQIIGIVLLFGLVFGSYLISGGNLAVILHALPHEMMAIGGAGVAAFLISNSMTGDQGHPAAASARCSPGPKWKAGDYRDLLSPAVPADQDHEVQGRHRPGKPHREPARERDLPALPEGHEGPLRRRLHLRHPADDDHEPRRPAPGRGRHGKAAREAPPRGAGARPTALQSLADALPALGIVAAVLGVIKTMGSITEPPEVLGGDDRRRLVGTFLGVFLAYGLVGPMATRLTEVVDEEGSLLQDHPVGAGRPPARQRRPDLRRDRPRQRPLRRPAQLPGTGRSPVGHPGRGLTSPSPNLSPKGRESPRAKFLSLGRG